MPTREKETCEHRLIDQSPQLRGKCDVHQSVQSNYNKKKNSNQQNISHHHHHTRNMIYEGNSHNQENIKALVSASHPLHTYMTHLNLTFK